MYGTIVLYELLAAFFLFKKIRDRNRKTEKPIKTDKTDKTDDFFKNRSFDRRRHRNFGKFPELFRKKLFRKKLIKFQVTILKNNKINNHYKSKNVKK